MMKNHLLITKYNFTLFIDIRCDLDPFIYQFSLKSIIFLVVIFSSDVEYREVTMTWEIRVRVTSKEVIEES